MAKFYDIANLIDQNYQNNCYVQMDVDEFFKIFIDQIEDNLK